MPRHPGKQPYSLHEPDLMAARRDLDSRVRESAFPFATAAREGRLRPRDPLDAITVAFAAAVDEILHAREARLTKEQSNARQRARTVTADLAKSLGMSAQTLREARDGDRWVTLPDMLSALSRRSDFGPVFEHYLEPLLRRWPYLLHKDAPGHPTLTLPRASGVPASQRDSVEHVSDNSRLTEADVLTMERTAREAIAALAAAQARAERAGRALPSEVNWRAVAGSLDPYANDSEESADVQDEDAEEPARPRPGMQTPGTKTLADYGIDNMNSTVREVFEDGAAHSAADVIARVRAVSHREQIARGLDIASVPDDTIRSALWRLHSQPTDPSNRWLVHKDNTYSPGPRMLRELDRKGTTEQP